MGKYSVSPARKRVFNKTMAVALAAGVSLGGVTVVAPMAGATAGHKGSEFVVDFPAAEADNPGLWDIDNEEEYYNIISKYPKANNDVYPTWGYLGGYYEDVKVPEGVTDGFSGRSTSGMVVPTVPQGFGPLQNVSSLKNNYLDIDRDLSIDVKKVMYVAFSFVDDIVKNNGLSDSAKSKLETAGYSGDYGKSYVNEFGIDEAIYLDKMPQESELLLNEKGKFVGDVSIPLTPGDVVAEAAAWLTGVALSSDTNGRGVGEDPSGPATFNDIETYLSMMISDTHINSSEDSLNLQTAMINLAKRVTEEDINNVDLYTRFAADAPADGAITYDAVYNPVFFDIANSTPAPVEDLSQAPVDDIYVDDISKQDNGDYLVTRNDGEEWTIPVGELADRIEDLENKPTVSPEDLDDIKKDLDKAKGDIKDLKASDDKLQGEIDKINDDLDKLTPRVDDLEDRVTDLENNGVKEVRDNGDGTYTIIRNDGSEVDGEIGDGQGIKDIKPNEDGSLTIIRDNGDEVNVDLPHTEITEENKGTPNHTVTITSPNGDTVTFNVFDNYVTDVVKNENGNYDIFRSDVDGGNTVWKTIVLSDLRDKIADLETRADGLDEKDADLQRQIDELKDSLGDTEKEIESLKDRTSDLEKAVAQINAHLNKLNLRVSAIDTRLTALEGRVDTAENTQHAWAQCFSGILGTAIPLLAAVPFIAGSNIQIPGAAQWNNQIQRTLGIYNEKLNRMAGQYSGVVKAAATILGVAGTIGLGVHTAKACGPYSKTDAMKETKAGKLSSKLDNKSTGSSREK